eukprot:379770_1
MPQGSSHRNLFHLNRFNTMHRSESNLDWYATGIIPQELISSESLVLNTMDDGFHGATSKHCKGIRKMRHTTQTLCIPSKPNTTTHDNTDPLSIWCDNAPKHNNAPVT